MLETVGVSVVSDSSGSAVFTELQVGEYEMALYLEGYRTTKGHLTVDREGLFTVSLTRLHPTETPSAGGVSGWVLAGESAEALAGVTVSLSGLPQTHTTDAHGRFEIDSLPAGVYRLAIEGMGRAPVHHSVEVVRDTVIELEIRLPIRPIELTGITVTAHPRWLIQSGFLRRRRATGAFRGRQWTRRELEARSPQYLRDVLSEITGVYRKGPRDMYAGNCRLTIYLNDFVMDERFDLDLIDPMSVEALEVYRGRPMPVGYSGCGAILVWLKR